MADLVDLAQEQQEREEKRRRSKPYHLPDGKRGDCEICGEMSARLINGVCAPCRDKYGLK